ncbi:MAG TPA: carboxypeptidase-like regulatory domain-containing protein [Verrucomicrobiae bacterium]|jgi:hypothetical protein|nr:carboxypeptidase-like regulatory domain-containing protein [Verrucomicrobiae bacterium]
MLARVLIGAMVVLGFGTNVFAGCTCSMPGGDCERAWSSGQVIFLGKVTADIATEAPVVEDSSDEGSEIMPPGSIKEPPMNHAVHFLIAESFRGEGQPGQDIVVHTGVDERGPRDGDCSYHFVVGVSYLVYASGVGDSLATSICTFTSPEVAVFGVLRELRAIRDGQPVDSLFGEVSLLPAKAERWLLSLTKMRPLGDVAVRLTDSAGRVRSTKTDERGVYAFEWLPPDSYRIEEDLPAELRVLSDRADKTLVVDLRDKEATRIGCRADIRARSDGQISGMVRDSQDRSVESFLGNKPADPKKQIFAPSADGTSSPTVRSP